MKTAVISDIHGNLEAFESVLEDLTSQDVDAVVSLGDNIGYGADSESIVSIIRCRGIISILGNHDLAVCHEKVRKWFRKDSRKAVDIAIDSLSEESKEYIRGLKTSLSASGLRFVHGFPPDSARFYLFQIDDSRMLQSLAELKESICFVGHTHQLRMVCREKGDLRSVKLEQGIYHLDRELKYIVNVGSVGQPRDGDPQAKYAIWDSDSCRLEIRYVPYDYETASRKIVAAGIPERYARILFPNDKGKRR